MTALSFDFKDCDGTTSLREGAALSPYAALPRSPHGAWTMQPAYGHLLLLNGVDLNQQVTDFGTWLTATSLLVSPAPFGVLMPMVNGVGEGRIRGDGYRWIFRFKNSATGEVTGFSALDPGEGTSLGVSLTAGGYLGQDAFFTIPGARTLDGTYMDTIQVFRNTTLESSAFYLEKELTGAGITGSGTVFFHDDKTDEELLLSGAETANLVPNPSFSTGVPDPRVKAFPMANGRVALYGLVRMEPWSCGATAAVVLDSQIVTSTVPVPPERIGQRFLPTGAIDNTQYRICDVRPVNTGASAAENLLFAITPAWKGATATLSFEIADDRDARTVSPSRPGLPTQFDATEQFGVGGDKTDELFHLCELRGTTFGLSRQGIFTLSGIAMTGAPVIPQRVASEGPCGLRAVADTPVGVVYVEAQKGVRIFSGGYSTLYGADAPKPLGGSSASASFGPLTQFRAIDPDYLGETRVLYDPTLHRVYVAYCPLGGGGLEECLAYQYEDETQNTPAVWRGPWRVSASCLFTLKDDAGGERVCIGDESGNVSTSDEAVVDVLDTDSGQSVSGTIATVPNAFMFTATAGTFDPSSDKRVVGVPIVFAGDGGEAPSGAVQVNRIAGFDGTNFVLLNIPSPPIVAGDTFKIGAVRWQMKTAWLDGGEPILPHMLERMRMRLARATAGASTAELSAAADGGTSFTAEDGGLAYTLVDPAPTIDGAVTPIIYHEGRLHREIDIGVMGGGRAHQIRLRGTSVDGHPRIDAAVADIEIHGGA